MDKTKVKILTRLLDNGGTVRNPLSELMQYEKDIEILRIRGYLKITAEEYSFLRNDRGNKKHEITVSEYRTSRHDFTSFYISITGAGIDYLEQNEDTTIIVPPKKKSAKHFIAQETIKKLEEIKSKDYDFSKLIAVCNQINYCYAGHAYFAVSALLRTIIDHVPPIFGCKNFTEVSNHYAGTVSFKKHMKHLSEGLKHLADENLHSQIRKKEKVLVDNSVNYIPEVEALLAEIIRLLK